MQWDTIQITLTLVGVVVGWHIGGWTGRKIWGGRD